MFTVRISARSPIADRDGLGKVCEDSNFVDILK
jgi:hypothetical protein